MSVKRSALSVVATSGFACIAALVVILHTPQPSEARTLLDAPIGVLSCNYHCRTCPNDKHDIVVAVKNEHHADHLETCTNGDCSPHACNATFASSVELGTLWEAVRAADAPELRRIGARHRGDVVLNQDRKAVQVTGCEGELLASIPLDQEQLAVFED